MPTGANLTDDDMGCLLLFGSTRGPRFAFEVVKWWFGTAMPADANPTKGDMNPAPTEEADLDPPGCPVVARNFIRGFRSA